MEPKGRADLHRVQTALVERVEHQDHRQRRPFLDYDSCAEVSCRYAYDFWNPDASNRMFPLLASKGGVVWAYKETCNNGDTQCTNYLVLKDDSTTPTTYQLYYHLARSSVPDSFVSKQTYVPQGGYIGNVDDTGASTDHHLHFMVYVTPSNTSAYSWGNSVRILFSDVPYNGGEPRTCAETINYSGYGTQCSMGKDGKKGGGDDDILASGNVGSNPPSGSAECPGSRYGGDRPAPWTSAAKPATTWGSPRCRSWAITTAPGGAGRRGLCQRRFQQDLRPVRAGYARRADEPGSAHFRRGRQLGGALSPACARSLRIMPAAPAPARLLPRQPALPRAGQIGVYSEVNFSGTCLRLGTGNVTAGNLGALNNKIASIQVSSGTCASAVRPG